MRFTCFVLLFYVIFDAVILGEFLDIDLNSDDYYVSSIATYRTRAFLALPRNVCFNNNRTPTLMEATWTNKNYLMSSANSIISGRNKILDFQQTVGCNSIQNAVSVEVEQKRHKLWILDKGNEFCNPKILSYHLFYNTISESRELSDVSREDLRIIVIDQRRYEYESRAYIGNAGENTLLVISLRTLKYWTLVVKDTKYPDLALNADFLAVSKTDPYQLFITGKNDLHLFTMNLEEIDQIQDPFLIQMGSGVNANITLLGEKLGKSSGLESDFKSGLSYFMTRDYAIVRWIARSPVVAEYHTVLAQSYEKFPYLSELFTDPQNSLWALVNVMSPEDCDAIAEDNYTSLPKLESRILKILTYNKYTNELEIDDMDLS